MLVQMHGDEVFVLDTQLENGRLSDLRNPSNGSPRELLLSLVGFQQPLIDYYGGHPTSSRPAALRNEMSLPRGVASRDLSVSRASFNGHASSDDPAHVMYVWSTP